MFINDETQKQVLAIIARTSVSPAADVQQRTAAALLQLNPGQQVKAEIVANLPNHLYLARIAGEMYKLEIPINVQPGETLELTYLTSDPRVTFQILHPDAAGSTVKLSPMGKWLSGVARDAPSLPVLQEPLVEGPPHDTPLLATRLRTALTQTGLFYESHLASWATGGMQLAEILKEPQGKLSRAASEGDLAETASERGGAEFADSRTLPLIKEQLLLLHSGLLTWRGDAWPGQGMELTITARDEEEEEAVIEATLSLDLTHLGGVEVQLRFGADGLGIEFVCREPGSSAVLKKGGDELRSALASAGLHLTRLAAKDDEKTIQ